MHEKLNTVMKYRKLKKKHFLIPELYIPGSNFIDYLKQVLPSDTVEAFFVYGSIFGNAMLCLGEKQGTCQ